MYIHIYILTVDIVLQESPRSRSSSGTWKKGLMLKNGNHFANTSQIKQLMMYVFCPDPRRWHANKLLQITSRYEGVIKKLHFQADDTVPTGKVRYNARSNACFLSHCFNRPFVISMSTTGDTLKMFALRPPNSSHWSYLCP